MRGLLRADLDPFAVDRVFFTHLQPDHTVDVVPLLFAIKCGAEGERERSLALYGPEPFEGFFGSIADAWDEWMLGDFPTEISELPHACPSPLDLPDLKHQLGARRTPPREHRLPAGDRKRRRLRLHHLDLARDVGRGYEGEVVLAEDGLRFGV